MVDIRMLDDELSHAITLLTQAAESLETEEIMSLCEGLSPVRENAMLQITLFLESLEEASKLVSEGMREGLKALKFAKQRADGVDESLTAAF